MRTAGWIVRSEPRRGMRQNPQRVGLVLAGVVLAGGVQAAAVAIGRRLSRAER